MDMETVFAILRAIHFECMCFFGIFQHLCEIQFCSIQFTIALIHTQSEIALVK